MTRDIGAYNISFCSREEPPVFVEFTPKRKRRGMNANELDNKKSGVHSGGIMKDSLSLPGQYGPAHPQTLLYTL